MDVNRVAFSEEPGSAQISHSSCTIGTSQRRRLAPAPPDARWDPTALPSDGDDDEPRWTELQLAAREGDLDRVEEILSRYPAPTERASVVNAPPEGWYSQTALQAACMREHEDVVRVLLSAGADIGAPGGNNIYMNAFELACGTGNMRLVRQLLDAGATKHVNPARVTRYQGRTPIQAAAERGSQDLVDLLLGLGAEINAPPSPSGGRTALQAACFEGHVGMVHHLLARGADVNMAAAKHGGFTALQAACRVGERPIVKVLLGGGADVNAPGDARTGGSALHAAAEGGHAEIVRMLLASGADCNALVGRPGTWGQTAVQSAYVQGHGEVVEVLLNAGATGPVYGGRLLYGHVTARSWSEDEMKVPGEGGEMGTARTLAAVRPRAHNPDPTARRTLHHSERRVFGTG